VSNLVPASDIERIVGAVRHEADHYGRAVSSEQTVYVLHSKWCRDSGIDLRECRYSLALDRGIYDLWAGFEDAPVVLDIEDGRLKPVSFVEDGLL